MDNTLSSGPGNEGETKSTPIENSSAEGQVDPSPVLEYAWRKYHLYSSNASKRKMGTLRVGNWILYMTVLVVLLAIISSLLKQGDVNIDSWLADTVRILMILAPITVSMLVSYANTFGGNIPRNFLDRALGGKVAAEKPVERNAREQASLTSSWEYLSRAASQVLSHIYLYRTRVGRYSDETQRDKLLFTEIKKIEDKLMYDTPVRNVALYYENLAKWGSYFANLYTDLNGDGYIKNRLEDELYWRRKIIGRRHQQKINSNLGVIVFGGLGTFLAAIGLEIWITLTTTIAGAFASVLENSKLDESIVAYNLTIHELDALFAWWRMLSSEERCVKENIEKLVTGTEKTILGDRSWNDVISGDITYLTSPPSTGVN